MQTEDVDSYIVLTSQLEELAGAELLGEAEGFSDGDTDVDVVGAFVMLHTCDA